LGRLLGLSVVGLLAVVAGVVVFGRLLGIPSSAGSFTTEGMQVTGRGDITTVRVKELMILNPDGTAAGAFKAHAGAILFNRFLKDGTEIPGVMFFEGGGVIQVNTGAWHGVVLRP
jgi:hypothetical protein